MWRTSRRRAGGHGGGTADRKPEMSGSRRAPGVAGGDNKETQVFPTCVLPFWSFFLSLFVLSLYILSA